MHEATIAMAIVEQVVEAASPHQVTRISEIEIDVGVLKQVVCESLLLAFEACAAGTLAEGAVLKINEIPPAAVCQECGQEFTPDLAEFSFVCPGCGKASVTVVGGDEILLRSMTCEQNDAPVTAVAPRKET
ncbi:MAG: hydrogenase maturation nickel metallochaperone HypA [Phycisphaerae bacterium]|nr:hydrogenase maturation nickel metallochaperone HypA [Phycisphaerae bacterium]